MHYVNNPNIIDIEASGFGGESYPIEVGLILGTGEKFCSLIFPADDWQYWSEEAEKVHHISRKMLENHGKSVSKVACLLNEKLAGMTLYSDGWVVDKPWLTRLFYASGVEMQFTVSSLEMILSDEQMKIWHKTKDKIIIQSNIQRHRASNDAWLIQETYRQTHQLSKGP
ncbi:hypothetical protein [Psychromonas sp. SP041]|uniref:hypothetical protein n=1 Tax=Psychromonas sp. SP041 TaxID=1365007 RepID=UPI0004036F7A|nr:hypothetical protein [Psychromonas sp. SP041]